MKLRLCLFLFLFPVLCMAQSPSGGSGGVVLMSQLSGDVTLATNTAPTDDPSSFLNQLVQVVQHFGGLPAVAKVSAIVLLLIASMKVNLINSLLWDKLGKWKTGLAPLLGLVVGVLMLHQSGESLTLAHLLAYAGSGAGAILLHELLDFMKAIPGPGAWYVAVINAIESALNVPEPLVGDSQTPAQPPAPPAA